MVPNRQSCTCLSRICFRNKLLLLQYITVSLNSLSVTIYNVPLCPKVVHSRFQDLVPVHLKDEGDPELDRPSEEDIEEVELLNHMQFLQGTKLH